MRKIVYILCILVISTSCSVSRREKRNKSESAKSFESRNFYESILTQNLTARSFFVEKALFKIKTEDGEKTGIGTIKFLIPDKFLISIKSKTGIEVARIFLTHDSIQINDRINKKLLYGSATYLKNKYGLTTSFLPVILGDYVNDERLDSNNIRCVDGSINIDGIIKTVKVKYQIDCELGKSIVTILEDNINENGLKIKYGDFFIANNINNPGKIEVSDKQGNATIEIQIQKIISPWEGTIEFIPGKQYEKIHLK